MATLYTTSILAAPQILSVTKGISVLSYLTMNSDLSTMLPLPFLAAPTNWSNQNFNSLENMFTDEDSNVLLDAHIMDMVSKSYSFAPPNEKESKNNNNCYYYGSLNNRLSYFNMKRNYNGINSNPPYNDTDSKINRTSSLIAAAA